MDEAAGVSTNMTAQSSLMAIEILELCADQLPTNPLPVLPELRGDEGRGGGGRGGQAATEPAE
jgi:hypothetical protein